MPNILSIFQLVVRGLHVVHVFYVSWPEWPWPLTNPLTFRVIEIIYILYSLMFISVPSLMFLGLQSVLRDAGRLHKLVKDYIPTDMCKAICSSLQKSRRGEGGGIKIYPCPGTLLKCTWTDYLTFPLKTYQSWSQDKSGIAVGQGNLV